jgi:hypothetical protein
MNRCKSPAGMDFQRHPLFLAATRTPLHQYGADLAPLGPACQTETHRRLGVQTAQRKRQRMIRLLLEGRAHSTKPERVNMPGRPMKLDTGASGVSFGGVG